ncbi:MAG: hypothetical protein AB7F31_05130 [Parachlamydiales bacterium]
MEFLNVGDPYAMAIVARNAAYENKGKILGITGIAVAALSYMGYRRYFAPIKVDLGGGQFILVNPRAKEILLKGCPHLTDAHLAQLAKFTRLESIRFEGCPLITPEGLLALKGCPKLTYVELTGCSIPLANVPQELVAFLNGNQHRILEGKMGLFQCIKVID